MNTDTSITMVKLTIYENRPKREAPQIYVIKNL